MLLNGNILLTFNLHTKSKGSKWHRNDCRLQTIADSELGDKITKDID